MSDLLISMSHRYSTDLTATMADGTPGASQNDLGNSGDGDVEKKKKKKKKMMMMMIVVITTVMKKMIMVVVVAAAAAVVMMMMMIMMIMMMILKTNLLWCALDRQCRRQ